MEVGLDEISCQVLGDGGTSTGTNGVYPCNKGKIYSEALSNIKKLHKGEKSGLDTEN